jgi:hypothetical protein
MAGCAAELFPVVGMVKRCCSVLPVESPQIKRECLGRLADARRAKLAVTQKQRIFPLGGLTFCQFV